MYNFGRLTIAFLTLALFIAAGFSATSVADEPMAFEVAAVENSAWVIRKDQAVKSSLVVGDALYPGDRIEVRNNHTLALSMNADRTNMLHVEGPSLMRISANGGQLIELERGKIFSLLDDIETGRRFEIKTPLAVAAVRGTHYQVRHDQTSHVLTYQGQVRVAGFDPLGNETGAVLVDANSSTSVTPLNRIPAKPMSLTAEESAEIEMVRDHLRDTREKLERRNVATRFRDHPAPVTTQESSSSTKNRKTEDSENSQGKLVY